jgi:hypothetical protein
LPTIEYAITNSSQHELDACHRSDGRLDKYVIQPRRSGRGSL